MLDLFLVHVWSRIFFLDSCSQVGTPKGKSLSPEGPLSEDSCSGSVDSQSEDSWDESDSALSCFFHGGTKATILTVGEAQGLHAGPLTTADLAPFPWAKEATWQNLGPCSKGSGKLPSRSPDVRHLENPSDVALRWLCPAILNTFCPFLEEQFFLRLHFWSFP